MDGCVIDALRGLQFSTKKKCKVSVTWSRPVLRPLRLAPGASKDSVRPQKKRERTPSRKNPKVDRTRE